MGKMTRAGVPRRGAQAAGEGSQAKLDVSRATSQAMVDDTQVLATKFCPQCGQELFEDMAVCYGCLYDFSRDDTQRVPALPDPLSTEDEVDEEAVLWIAQVDDGREGRESVGKGLATFLPTQYGLFVQTGDVDLVVPLPDGGVSVGRMPTNDIVLHSRAVSKRHLLLLPTDEGVRVEDQGATNPAILKGREITGSLTMAVGETIDVCGALLTLVERS